MSLENNLRISFAEVRKDILEIKNQIIQLAEGIEKVEAQVSELKSVKKSSRKRK